MQLPVLLQALLNFLRALKLGKTYQLPYFRHSIILLKEVMGGVLQRGPCIGLFFDAELSM